jgi:hypothetical protein
MFRTSLPDHIFNIERAPFAGVELADPNLDLGSKYTQLVQVVDQLTCDAILVSLGQRFDFRDCILQNLGHAETLSYAHYLTKVVAANYFS